MNTLNVIMIMAIILFARLAIRLIINYKKMKSEIEDDENKGTDELPK